MWFRGVAASVGLCFDFGAVLEGHPEVVLSVNGDVVHHRQSMRLLTAGSLVRVQLGEPKEYSLSTVGVDDAGGPPVSIPNTEVKPCSAEDSALATECDNRRYAYHDANTR